LNDNNPDTKNFPTEHSEVTGHMKITVSLKDTEINLKTNEKTTVYTSGRVTFTVTNLFTLRFVQYLKVNK
jgi:hypothetical protein